LGTLVKGGPLKEEKKKKAGRGRKGKFCRSRKGLI